MTFYEQLYAATQPARTELLTIPLLKAGVAGRLSRETYLAFLTE
ncbi:MAG: hypothetical protein FD130_2397, partial [Halothiobacillaceae bacterium]